MWNLQWFPKTQKPEPIIVQTSDEISAPDENNTYKIENITDNVTVRISVGNKQCTVRLPEADPEGYTALAAGSSTVTPGTNYSFYITSAQGIEQPDIKGIKVKDTQGQIIENVVIQKISDTQYMIVKVNQDMTVELPAPVKKQVKVILSKSEDCEVTLETQSSEFPSQVDYGE